MFADDILAPLMRDAAARAPEESCGLIIAEAGTHRYLSCENIAADKHHSFLIADEVLLPHLDGGRLRAVVHSHPAPHEPVPSQIDMQGQLAMHVPWGIVPVSDAGEAEQPFFWGEGVPVPELIGRPYRHGVTDCYSVIRDYYRLERSITLPDFAREWAWWEGEGPSLYEQYFESAGFGEVAPHEADIGDGLLLQVGGRIISHAALMVAPGLMLHHPAGRHAYDPISLSRRDAIARWQPYIHKVLRYGT